MHGRAGGPLRGVAAVGLCVVIAGLTSCSEAASGTNKQTPTSPVAGMITAAPANHNAADAAFFTALITHYGQGVELSALASARSTNANVTAFAQQSGDAMQSDLQVMKALLVQWTDGADGTPGGDSSPTTPTGMADQATMDKVAALDGTEFDALWLETVLTLHAGALDMAKAETINGTNIDAVAFAQRLTKTEQTALDHINQLREQMGNG
jgi:uncharacterized protein (DUF305 family)